MASISLKDKSSKSDSDNGKVLCKFFLNGFCSFGEKCRYSHVVPENLRASNLIKPMVLDKKERLYKTELCRIFEEKGSCHFGESCQYAHGEQELRSVQKHRKFKTEKCKRFEESGECPFVHRCCFLHDESPTELPESPNSRIRLYQLKKAPTKETSISSRSSRSAFDSPPTKVTKTHPKNNLNVIQESEIVKHPSISRTMFNLDFSVLEKIRGMRKLHERPSINSPNHPNFLSLSDILPEGILPMPLRQASSLRINGPRAEATIKRELRPSGPKPFSLWGTDSPLLPPKMG